MKTTGSPYHVIAERKICVKYLKDRFRALAILSAAAAVCLVSVCTAGLGTAGKNGGAPIGEQAAVEAEISALSKKAREAAQQSEADAALRERERARHEEEQAAIDAEVAALSRKAREAAQKGL